MKVILKLIKLSETSFLAVPETSFVSLSCTLLGFFKDEFNTLIDDKLKYLFTETASYEIELENKVYEYILGTSFVSDQELPSAVKRFEKCAVKYHEEKRPAPTYFFSKEPTVAPKKRIIVTIADTKRLTSLLSLLVAAYGLWALFLVAPETVLTEFNFEELAGAPIEHFHRHVDEFFHIQSTKEELSDFKSLLQDLGEEHRYHELTNVMFHSTDPEDHRLLSRFFNELYSKTPDQQDFRFIQTGKLRLRAMGGGGIQFKRTHDRSNLLHIDQYEVYKSFSYTFSMWRVLTHILLGVLVGSTSKPSRALVSVLHDKVTPDSLKGLISKKGLDNLIVRVHQFYNPFGIHGLAMLLATFQQCLLGKGKTARKVLSPLMKLCFFTNRYFETYQSPDMISDDEINGELTDEEDDGDFEDEEEGEDNRRDTEFEDQFLKGSELDVYLHDVNYFLDQYFNGEIEIKIKEPSRTGKFLDILHSLVEVGMNMTLLHFFILDSITRSHFDFKAGSFVTTQPASVFSMISLHLLIAAPHYIRTITGVPLSFSSETFTKTLIFADAVRYVNEWILEQTPQYMRDSDQDFPLNWDKERPKSVFNMMKRQFEKHQRFNLRNVIIKNNFIIEDN